MKSALAQLLATATVAAFAATLTASDAGGTWVQLLPAGTFDSPRDGRGPFTTGDRTAMETIVATTLKIAGATELVVDYDHQSVFGAKDGVGGRAPASGWIKELQVRDDGIFGRVEWTEAAAAAIQAGEYRYLSPVFLHNKAGKVLAIRMAALTNTPSLDLQAVAASALLATSAEGVPMDRIASALGLAAGSGEDSVLAALNTLLTATTAIAKAVGLKDDARPADIQTAVASAIADRAKLITAAGGAADAKADDVATAIMTAVKGGGADPTKFVPIEQVAQLQRDVKTLQEQLAGDKAEEAVASAIKDGRLVPALKDWGLDYAKKDLAGFETFIGNSPVLTAPQLKQPKKDGSQGAELDDAQLAICSAMGLSPEDFKKTLAAEAANEEAR